MSNIVSFPHPVPAPQRVATLETELAELRTALRSAAIALVNVSSCLDRETLNQALVATAAGEMTLDAFLDETVGNIERLLEARIARRARA